MKEPKTTKGLVEVVVKECPRCGDKITGHSDKQANTRLEMHQRSKKCKKHKK